MFDVYGLTKDEEMFLKDTCLSCSTMILILEDSISTKKSIIDCLSSQFTKDFYFKEINRLEGILSKFKKFKEDNLNEM